MGGPDPDSSSLGWVLVTFSTQTAQSNLRRPVHGPWSMASTKTTPGLGQAAHHVSFGEASSPRRAVSGSFKPSPLLVAAAPPPSKRL
ncbi:uncharacterized protein TrAtP1_011216 [Trichoderma atroviride]|uniref:uncharacterized protein n=1 Tax=Hypocrea atroviridis TaxID=63577 RepID=UPI00331AD66C|nr:hypothetical protein TrAtP1_011216 [Trichoderma atroviride]